MSDKNNLGLSRHVQKAAYEEWGYVLGTYGQILTPSLLDYKLNQYPEIRKYEDYIREQYLKKKKRTADCVGLIKSYIWWKDDNPVYDSRTDVDADTMFGLAVEKGDISTLPEIEGICVYKRGHTGVYIGNDTVIEAKGTKYGVVKTPLKGSGATAWTHWYKCPFITYIEDINWEDIIKKVTTNPSEWINTINMLTNFAISNAHNNIGDFKILAYLPNLIKKLYNANR